MTAEDQEHSISEHSAA